MINNVAIRPTIITLDNDPQIVLDENDYIEINESITNFEQLTQQKNFNLIQNEYKKSIIKLSELYYYFSGKKCESSVRYTINLIYSTDKTLFSDLFYSYKQIRKCLATIINYLDSCKENREDNDHIGIICSKLEDCFGFCLSGFNAKIANIDEYMIIYRHIDLRSKINVKIKQLLEEVIIKVLINSNDQTRIPSSNVHYQVAFFNLVADDFNLPAAIHRGANLHNVTTRSIENIVDRIKNKLPPRTICKYITDYLYSIFKDCLFSLGKNEWHNNIISDLNMENILYLENNFITPINKYLRLKNEESLKISDIFIEQEAGDYKLADIQFVLNYLLAINIKQIIKNLSNIYKLNNLIIKIDSNTSINSIYDCCFYVLSNKFKEPVTLQHLLKLNLDNSTFNLGLVMLEDSKEEDIYSFFNALWNKKSIDNKYIKYMSTVINNYTPEESSIQQKIVNAITKPYTNRKTQKKSCFLLYNLIVNYILANEIIERLLKNKFDLNPLLKLFNKEKMYSFISKLGVDALFKIMFNYNHIDMVKKVITNMLNKRISESKNLALLEKIDLKLIDEFLILLNDETQKQLLENIINDYTKYNIAKKLINYFIKYDIRDKEKNSILHKIVQHNDKTTLKEIIENLDSTAMHQLQFAKNSKEEIPLTYVITIGNDCKDIIVMLLENNKDILSAQNNYGNTALLCSVIFNKIEYVELMLKYYDKSSINKQNRSYNNALMEASIQGSDDIINAFLINTNIRENIDFLSAKNREGNNSLMLAIINKHESSAILHIDNYRSKILHYKNNRGENILMLAVLNKMEHIVKKILTQYSHSDIKKADETSRENGLMLSINNNNSHMTKLLLENMSCINLNKLNNQQQSVLNLAIKFNSKHLKQIINLSSKNHITHTFYEYGILWDALAQACYHGLDDTILTALLKKSNNYFLLDKGSNSALLQAFSQGHLHCIKFLHSYLTEKDFINVVNKNEYSCLAISIQNNYYDCAEYIMKNFTQDAIQKMMPKYINIRNNRMKRIIGK